MTAYYNPYGKMLVDLQDNKIKSKLEQITPEKQRNLERSRKVLPDTADKIEADKAKAQALRATVHQQRLSTLEREIEQQREANAQYIHHEVRALQTHAEESALMKNENERIWQASNAQALQRSRFLLGSVTQDQIDREVMRNHYDKVRIANEIVVEANVRGEIERSRILAEAAMRDQMMIRSNILKASMLTPFSPY